MKKIIILIILIFLLISCNNINENKESINYIEENNNLYMDIEEEIALLLYNDDKNEKDFWIIKNNDLENLDIYIDSFKDLVELNKFFIENDIKRLHIWFENYSDDDYEVFSNLKDFDSLGLDFWPLILGNIEKTLKIISDNIKNKWEDISLTLEFLFDKRNFTKLEINILKDMNITVLEIHWWYLDISFPNPSNESIKKYRKEKTEFDENINYILNNSKTLNKIIVLDYKIFTKKDWKIEVEDWRMSREKLQELWLY